MPTPTTNPSSKIWQCRGYAIKRGNGKLATNVEGIPHFLFNLHAAGMTRDEVSLQLGKCKVVTVTMEIHES
jgi:hypothetical protein